MARIAFIETYPYEAAWGGDAVYLDAIRLALTARGHEVDTYVTNILRGRSSPTVILQTAAAANHRWHVCDSVPLGSNCFMSVDPRALGNVLRRLPGRRAAKDDRITGPEVRWVVQKLRDSLPDLAVLAFDACNLVDRIAATGVPVLALKGFFSDRRIQLGQSIPAPKVAPELLDQLAHAAAVGFNNVADCQLYGELTGQSNGMLIGVAFKSRIQTPSNSKPSLLYVAARTKPNVQSLEWFLHSVWPIVHDVAPQTELRVVGAIGSAFAYASFPQVSFVGFVDELELEYRRSWAVVAPFVNGSSGVKTKIAEALSYGRPVVTTSIGIDHQSAGEFEGSVVVADEPARFAAALLKLISDNGHRRNCHASAADQFRKHFTTQSAYSSLWRLLDSASDRRLMRVSAPRRVGEFNA